jgi:predicted enzyme related to lactoylglutathione lyase
MEGAVARNEEEGASVGSDSVDARLARHGGLSYLEIPAVNTRLSAAFYEEVLGWSVREKETEEPRFSDTTGHLIGRWVTGRAIARDSGFLPYFYVEHIGEVVKRAAALGGEVVKPLYREGNLWVATVRDPAGNVLGLWEQASG